MSPLNVRGSPSLRRSPSENPSQREGLLNSVGVLAIIEIIEALPNSFLASADKFKIIRTQFFNYCYGFVNPSAFK